MQIIYTTKYPRSSAVELVLCIAVMLLMSSLHVQICIAEGNMCSHANYTKASKFERNLNMVLNNLVNRINSSSDSGFNTSVSGKTPDTAYGFLQCRGDATKEICYSCSQSANTTIRQDCANATGGAVFLDNCFMRYENYSFVGKLDTTLMRILHNTGNATNPDVYSAAVKGLFKNLTEEAYRSANRYSSGTTYVDVSFQRIFGLVQCWRDITSIDNCTTCLSTAIGSLLELTVTEAGTFLGGQALLGSCYARYESYPFFNSPPPPPPAYPPPIQQPPLSPQTQKKSSNKLAIILGILGGFLVMLLVCMFAVRRKLKSALFGKSLVLGKENRGMDVGSLIGQDEQIIFNLEILRDATSNFHEDNKLGEGGFGAVYKGIMPDGKQVAVKKLSIQSRQGREEFLNEVKLVAKIQHRNLVNLLGCCTEGSERLLVYEFLLNGSLDKILFHPHRSKELEWQRRLNIIRGVARGLLYLHEDSQVRIVHRDIKASNILLDEKMEPRISDFGLARLFAQDETHVSTRIAGTYGYMAPEYAMRGQLSAKSDVYSFGVVLLEIVCGKKNTDKELSPEFQSLLEMVWIFYTSGKILDVIDRAIIESCPKEHVSSCVHVALLCTQADASLRPPMSTVYVMLSDLSMSNLPNPTKPSFMGVSHKDVPTQKDTFASGGTNSTSVSSAYDSSATIFIGPSINDASVTNLEAR